MYTVFSLSYVQIEWKCNWVTIIGRVVASFMIRNVNALHRFLKLNFRDYPTIIKPIQLVRVIEYMYATKALWLT